MNNQKSTNTQSQTLNAAPPLIVLADFTLRDWHLAEVDEWTGPESHRDLYRCVIEQDPRTKGVSFAIYPSIQEDLRETIDTPYSGIFGILEIRNGAPGISIGSDENDHPIHIESDVYQGLYLHTDRVVTEFRKYESFDHGTAFDSQYFYTGSTDNHEEIVRQAAAKMKAESTKTTVDSADPSQSAEDRSPRTVDQQNAIGDCIDIAFTNIKNGADINKQKQILMEEIQGLYSGNDILKN